MTRLCSISLALVIAPVAASAQATMTPPDGFERIELTGNGETLVCMTGGSGSPMLLLHGWPQTAAEWKPVLPQLSANHTVYACDLPGVRDSSNTDGDNTKAGIADDIHAAFEGVGPMHLVGHDIGLMVVYSYATAFPQDVLSLTLMDAPLPGTDAFDQIAANPSAWHFDFHQVEEVPEAVIGNSVEFYVDHFISTLWAHPDGPPDEVIAASAEAYKDADTLATGFEWYRAFPQDAEDNALKFETPLEMPVLALNAGAISPGPYVLQMMEPLANDLRGGAIADTGHWMTEEAPDEVASRILDMTTGVDW